MKSAYIDGLAPRRSKAVSQNSKSTTPVFKKNMTNPLPRKQLLDPLKIERKKFNWKNVTKIRLRESKL